MKKLMVLAFCLVITQLAWADDETPLEGQFAFYAENTFLESDCPVSLVGSAMLMGSTMAPGLSLFTYLGPKIKIGESLNIYLLGGAYLDAGSSVISSVWLDYTFDEKNNIFAEIDYYAPYQDQLNAIYLYGAFMRSTDLNFDYGLAYEAMEYTRDGKFFESAVGPVLKLDNFKFWLAYDEQPSLNGDRAILRVNYSF